MNKSELVDAVAEEAGITKKDVTAALEAFADVVKTVVAAGDEVRLTGFGTFDSVERSARSGVNGFNGQPWSTPATCVPKFKAGAAFKTQVAERKRVAL